jgi:predicted O-methyltransferase YrrM
MKNLFTFLLQYTRLKPAISQTTETERACLSRYAAGKKKLVEVGVFQGVTTRVLRQVMHPNAILFGIDPFYKNRLGVCLYRIIADREVGSVANGEVKWLEMTSAQALQTNYLMGSSDLDFVFIDGDHSWEGIKADWEGFSALIPPGGIIAIHDSRNRGGCGSERFTNEVILQDPRFHVVETEHSLTVLERF